MQLRAFIIATLLIAGTAGMAPANSIRAVGSLNVDRVEFEKTPVSEALEFLRVKSEELDPEKKGISFILGSGVDKSTPVTLHLVDVPLGVVLSYVTELSGLEHRVDAHAIRILPRDPDAPALQPKANPYMASRARGIVFPQVDFADATLAAVADYLARKSVEVDAEKKGVNLVLGTGVDPETRISLRLKDTPLANVLGYAAETAGLKVRADRWAIVFYKPETGAPDAKTSQPGNAKPPPAPRVAGRSSTADTGGLRGATLGNPVKDPRSPAHPDYVKSTDPVVPDRTNALGNAYRWINGVWTYTGPKYKKVDGRWVPAEDGAKLEPASGLDRKPR